MRLKLGINPSYRCLSHSTDRDLLRGVVREDQRRSDGGETPSGMSADVVLRYARTYHDHERGKRSDSSDFSPSLLSQHADQHPAHIAMTPCSGDCDGQTT
jgi:hypothetical protein